MISRKVFLIMMNQGVGAGLGMISLILIGRYIPPGDFGVVGFAIGIVGMLSFMGDLGFSFAHVKRMTEGKDQGECIGTFMSVKLILTGIIIASTLAFLLLWQNSLGHDFESEEAPLVIIIIMGYYALLNLQQAFTYTFQARMNTALQELPTLIMNITKFAVLLMVVFWNLGLYMFAATYLLGSVAGILTSLVFFLRMDIKVKRPTLDMFKSYWSYAMPLLLSFSVATVATNVDKVLIQLFWTSAEVGIFLMSQRVILLITALSAAIGALILPTVSKAHSRGRTGEIKKLVRISAKYISMIMIPITIFMVVFPDYIVNIIGVSYSGSAGILRIHVIYAYMLVMSAVYNYTINGMDKPDFTAKVNVLIASLCIALDLILIPEKILGMPAFGLGAGGAAWAAVISMGAGLAVSMRYIKRNLKIRLNWGLGSQVMAGTAAGLVLLLLAGYIEPTRIFILIPFFLLGLGIFIGLLALTGKFRRSDLKYILETVNPRKMYGYVKNEVHGKESD